MSVTIKAHTRRAMRDIRKASHETLIDLGQEIRGVAMGLVPVDTGNLRDNINFDVDGITLAVFTTTGYGGFVELGTSRMAAQPYLTPGVMAAWKAIFGKAFEK